MEMDPVLVTISSYKQGILFQCVDGPAGLAYQISMSWEELEAHIKANGMQIPIGEFGKRGAKHLRDMM